MPLSKVDGVRLFYKDFGPRDGVPLVFIHGVSLSTIIDIDNNPHKIWIPQIEHFKAKRRVIVFDLRGFGQSDKPKEKYSIEVSSDDLYSLLKNLEIKKAIIVGYSMGGMVALRFVLDYPEMVDKLILISTTASMQLPYWRKLLLPLWVRIIMRKFPANLTHRYIVSSCFSAMANFNVVSELPKIQVPTLVIHAEGETRFPLKQAKCIKEHIPNAKLVILEGETAHLHPISTPEKTWENIEEFVSN